MNVQTITAHRPRLTLFGRTSASPNREAQRSGTLSGKELQQIVADILG
jgi:hypothetical protein